MWEKFNKKEPKNSKSIDHDQVDDHDDDGGCAGGMMTEIYMIHITFYILLRL